LAEIERQLRRAVGQGQSGETADELAVLVLEQRLGQRARGAWGRTVAQAKSSGEGQGGGSGGGGSEVRDADASSANNQPAPADRHAPAADEDADIAAGRFAQPPWFAKLPPEVRQAIQAKTRRPPPRGYEERLRRYFESGQ
jgi:hypothetical protein